MTERDASANRVAVAYRHRANGDPACPYPSKEHDRGHVHARVLGLGPVPVPVPGRVLERGRWRSIVRVEKDRGVEQSLDRCFAEC